MKRSEINKIILDALDFADEMGFKLPPFARWTPEEWAKVADNEEYDEIRDNMLGWDITDFGSGDYHKIGLLMFTIRNGNYGIDKYTKPYAEKMLITEENQVTPYHFHRLKMEDIINRGGADLIVQIYNADKNEKFADTPVHISMDGRNFMMPAGSKIRVRPGESITLLRGSYHCFWAEGGKVLLGEVSKVNDDRIDNRFYEKTGRFPKIEEDEKPVTLLSMDYSEGCK